MAIFAAIALGYMLSSYLTPASVLRDDITCYTEPCRAWNVCELRFLL